MKTDNELLQNIRMLHTTPMGMDRIRRNLGLGEDVSDVVEFCRNAIIREECQITRQGKNWYCEIGGIIITVNAYSYTIITAHAPRNDAKRPNFDDIKSYEEFSKYYWYREELQQICKSHGIDASGMKAELNYNIEQFFKGTAQCTSQ